jgi:hypothetical protein
MMVEIFGRLQHVHELKEDIDVQGQRLYVFLKEQKHDGKTFYEYLGSMLSNLADRSSDFFKAFLPIATHYTVPPDETVSAEALQLKAELDQNARGLVFEGKDEV